jgi:hypothetical protein
LCNGSAADLGENLLNGVDHEIRVAQVDMVGRSAGAVVDRHREPQAS